MVRDVVPAEVPLVLDLLLADLAVQLAAHRVHVQDVLWGVQEEGVDRRVSQCVIEEREKKDIYVYTETAKRLGEVMLMTRALISRD